MKIYLHFFRVPQLSEFLVLRNSLNFTTKISYARGLGLVAEFAPLVKRKSAAFTSARL